MKRFNVYGISDWPEELGKEFDIFIDKPFADEQAAIDAAHAAYDATLEVRVEEIV